MTLTLPLTLPVSQPDDAETGDVRFGALRTHDRFDYLPITARDTYRWPNGARLAVYLGFNLEHFAFGEGLGANLGPVSPQPDVLNYSWREYGNRVGAWRCLDLFDDLAMRAGVVLNTALLEDKEFTAWVERRTPMGRWAKPEELGGAVVFLASPAADFITGQTIAVNGRRTLA